MKCDYEYRVMLNFLARTEFPVEPDFVSDEAQTQIAQLIDEFIRGIHIIIENDPSYEKGWEVNSHSIAIAPDKSLLVSILLQRKRA